MFGPVFLTQAIVNIGKMPRGGRIINTGSVVSKMGLPIASIYGAAKAAQDSLTASWASAVSPLSYKYKNVFANSPEQLGKSHGITVNTIALGPVPTDTSKQYLQNADGSPSVVHDDFVGQTRADFRVGTAEDVADAALLLISEKSRWITAQWISVSGGITGTM